MNRKKSKKTKAQVDDAEQDGKIQGEHAGGEDVDSSFHEEKRARENVEVSMGISRLVNNYLDHVQENTVAEEGPLSDVEISFVGASQTLRFLLGLDAESEGPGEGLSTVS
jgi:hypothetical protein